MRKEDILVMSVDLAKAHLAASQMDPSEIPAFIQGIHNTLLELYTASQTAAVVDPSVSDDDGKATVAPILNEDISGPEFEGLDTWLAKRLHPRIAKKLNRASSLHPSVFDDYLICLEDGREVKLLRPYVEKRFGLSFAEYMDKWNLPDQFPIAPARYLAAKRVAAKKTGLGSSLRGARGKAKSKVVAKA